MRGKGILPTADAPLNSNAASSVTSSEIGRGQRNGDQPGLARFRPDLHCRRRVARQGKQPQPRIDGQLHLPKLPSATWNLNFALTTTEPG